MRIFRYSLIICFFLFSRDAFPQETGAAEEALRSLNRIESKMTEIKSLKADFIQEKDLVIFKKKVTLSGRIYMQKSNRLAWHVDKPVRYSVLITDKVIRQWDEDTDRVQEIAISENPIMRTVFEQLTVWFNGRYTALLKDYDVKLVQKNPVVFEFSPKASNAAIKVIRSITIGLKDDERYLKWIKILEINGDSTTIKFNNTILNPLLDDRDFEVKGRV